MWKLLIIALCSSLLISCGKSSKPQTHMDLAKEQNRNFFNERGYVKSYVKNNKYADALESCVYAYDLTESCAFSFLPLLGQSHTDSVPLSKIMERVVVSHPWMGKRFKEMLQGLSANSDLLLLFRSVTAIVISDNIRPSFYTESSGAIYIDSKYLYITDEEYQQTPNFKDYRENYVIDIDYDQYGIYVLNGESLSVNPLVNGARDFERAKLSLYRLLYHELGHANDFLPPQEHQRFSLQQSPQEVADKLWEEDKLLSQKMLHKNSSSLLKRLANIIYGGKEDGVEFNQQNSAEKVLLYFEHGEANDLYGHYTDYEDFSMILEEYMILKNHQVNRAAIFYDYAQERVLWAQKNRIYSNKVYEKAESIHKLLDLKSNFLSGKQPVHTFDAGTTFDQIKNSMN